MPAYSSFAIFAMYKNWYKIQGFDPLPFQRVPLCTILKSPFLAMDSKNFLKAPSVPIYANFEKGVRAEKKQVLVKIF